jgi:serine/threonine-protein kinase RsbW
MSTPALTVPAQLDRLGDIRRYVETAGKQAGLSEEAAYALVLAVDELATNIIMHGYSGLGTNGDVSITAGMDEEKLTVTLEDHGKPFDPGARTMPSAEELSKPLEERGIGGLGIYLALQSVDQHRYERLGDANRNILTMKRGQKTNK